MTNKAICWQFHGCRWNNPVVLRFQAYANASNIDLSDHANPNMLENQHLQDWIADALQETWILQEDEAGEVLEVKGVLA